MEVELKDRRSAGSCSFCLQHPCSKKVAEVEGQGMTIRFCLKCLEIFREKINEKHFNN